MDPIFKRAFEIKNEIIENRRHLHTCPEVGFDLFETTAYIKKRLIEMGLEPIDVETSGICVNIVGGKPGKVVLLRADMDALPMKEDSGLPFASKVDRAHTCGHDMHSSMLLGAAKILNEIKSELKGTVKLIFQPAEEILTGAKTMIASGILKNPDVDVAFGMHVGADAPYGGFGYKVGATHASSDVFEIIVQGKGCHGAMPHLGVDPINVAVHIHLGLQELLSREIIAAQPAVITVCQFQSGTAMNIIPDEAVMRGSIRVYDQQVRELILRRMVEISEYTAKAFGATAQVNMLGSIPSVKNDEETVNLMLDVIKKSGMENLEFKERAIMGSEDFAYYSHEVPSAFLSLGCAVDDEDKRYSLHNPKIIFNEDSLPVGAAIHAAFAKAWLDSH